MQTSNVMKKLSMATATAILMALGSAGSALAASLYTINDLGGLSSSTYPDFNTIANDINNNGQVVGSSYSFSALNLAHSIGQWAFIWENGNMTQLKPTSYYMIGSSAEKINDAGQVTGWAYYGANIAPTLWNGDNIRTLAPFSADVVDMNNQGQIILKDSSGRYFIGATNKMNLTPLNNPVYDINDLGHTIGSRSSGSFFCDKGITEVNVNPSGNPPVIIGFPCYGNTQTNLDFAASKLNNKGQVIGGNYFWENGQKTDIGFQAKDINDNGAVVGYLQDKDGFQRAYLWDNGSAIDLNDLLPDSFEWELTEARGINNLGQIIALARVKIPSGTGYVTPYRSFILNPIPGSVYEPTKSVPEPASVLSLLAFGALGVGAITKRQRQNRA